MKKIILMLLIMVISIASFAQVRAKVVLGSQPPHRHYYHRHYEHRRYYSRPYRHYPRRRSGVVLKARL